MWDPYSIIPRELYDVSTMNDPVYNESIKARINLDEDRLCNMLVSFSMLKNEGAQVQSLTK